jgi:hypothetical protein
MEEVIELAGLRQARLSIRHRVGSSLNPRRTMQLKAAGVIETELRRRRRRLEHGRPHQGDHPMAAQD